MGAAAPAGVASKEAERTVPTTLAPPSNFHGEDGVSGVDGPAEAGGALYGHDVADLCGVEQRRDSGHQVLTKRRGSAEQVSVRPREGHDLRRDCGRELVGIRRILDRQYASNAGQLRCLRGNRCGVRRADHNGNFSAGDAASTGHALGGAGIELRAIVLGDN